MFCTCTGVKYVYCDVCVYWCRIYCSFMKHLQDMYSSYTYIYWSYMYCS